MATEQEIKQSLNRLIAAKLRGHAAEIVKIAERIEAGEVEPSADDLQEFDKLTPIVTRPTLRVIEGGKGRNVSADTSYANGDRAMPGVYSTPLTGLRNPSPVEPDAAS